MSTVTLEFYLSDVGRSGITTVREDQIKETIHAKSSVAEHLDPLPLCWVAEGKRRPEPATVEDWEVSFDHETLPTFFLVDHDSFVTCRDCKEWIHA